MKTDVFVKVLSEKATESEMEADIDEAFRMFREFESRLSRFRPESELSQFNASEEMVLSSDFFSLLEMAKKYHEKTNGIFDPSILSALEAEGYGGSFRTESFGKPSATSVSAGSFHDLTLDSLTKTARKPRDLRLDLGGIGKGHIVDKVSKFLRMRYEHYFVYAGGDIFASGKNMEEGYDFWAVDVEDPETKGATIATLLLLNRAVATSGTNRRFWYKDGEKKHHLIDPKTKQSAKTDLLSVTVVAKTVCEAEVWAKTLVILGNIEGWKRSLEKRIPALFVTEDGRVRYNNFILPYVWKS